MTDDPSVEGPDRDRVPEAEDVPHGSDEGATAPLGESSQARGRPSSRGRPERGPQRDGGRRQDGDQRRTGTSRPREGAPPAQGGHDGDRRLTRRDRPAARGVGRSDVGSSASSGGGRPPRGGAGRAPHGPDQPPRLLGPRRAGPSEPQLPADVAAADLERPVRAELRTLSKANADVVARHLVMTARLLPEDPQAAYAHAMAAQRRAGRVAVVREAVGVAAYHAGLWAEALSELRAARRMSGSSHQLPLMADAERGLGRPERALELATSPEAASLSAAERVELSIVASGARRDLGQADAAVLALQIPELTAGATHAFTPRLRYAYADALLDAGRRDEAVHWFALAADTDQDGDTDAEERLAELQGLVLTDLEDDPAEEPEAQRPVPSDQRQGDDVAPRPAEDGGARPG